LRIGRQYGDFRRIVLGEAPGERTGYCERREVLVLGEDVAPRGGDCVEVQRPDLGDGRLAGERGLGTRDRHVDVRCGDRDARRPHVGSVRRDRRRAPFAGGAPPALSCEIAECARAVAGDGDPDIVERRIADATVIDAPGIVGQMVTGVEAAPRQVVPAYKCDDVVDDDDLLVVRCSHRMLVIKAKLESPVRAPVELVDRQPFAFHRVQHREVPRQHVAVQRSASRNDRIEELAERFGQPIVGAVGTEPHPAVDVPAQDVDRVPRVGERGPHGAEVLDAVDEQRDFVGALDPPAVATRRQQRRYASAFAPVRITFTGGFEAGFVRHAIIQPAARRPTPRLCGAMGTVSVGAVRQLG